MRGKLGYALRETLINLRRNLLLTTAGMLTAAVSLVMVGSALLVRHGFENANQRWEGGIEFEVFLKTDATEDQTDRVRRELLAHPDVARADYVSQEEQYELFQVLFHDRPEYLENIEPKDLPPSYRVEPKVKEADLIDQIGRRFAKEPGVREVTFAHDTIQTVQRVFRYAQWTLIIIASFMLFAASLLIFNTIRMAIFARRREIEVMKLVGATNWFIRVPFMIEGLVQGLVGAAVAFGGVYVLGEWGIGKLNNFDLFRDFVVLGSQVLSTGLLMVVLGAAIGAVGAGVAVTRFLDV